MVAKKATKKKAATRRRPAAAPVRKKKASKKASKKAMTVKKDTPLADIKAQLKEDAANIANKIGSASGGNKIVITRNKTFKFPDGTELPEFDGVIVDFRTHHLYYDQPYREGQVTPPACFAIGDNPRDMHPSQNSPDMQCEEEEGCQVCPLNEFGSSGNAKACQNRRVLAILAADADDSSDILTLSVSPTGLRRYDAYVGIVKADFDMPPIAVITHFSFDPNVEYSSLVFSDPLPNQQLQAMFHRKAEAVAILEAEPQLN